MNDLVDIGIRYGLPTLLLFGMAFAYERRERAIALEREAWNKERQSLYDARIAEGEARVKQAEGFGERLLKMQEISASVVAKTNEMLAQSNQRERELRDEQRERDRAERSVTGGQRPWKGPG